MGELRKRKQGNACEGRLIIAISGLPGTGKTTLARALVERLAGVYVGFGDHVRTVAAEHGQPSDRSSLQDLGEALVRDNPAGFVADAVSHASPGWRALVVDGVRHRIILDLLRDYADENDASLQLVHLAVDMPDRIDRMVSRGTDPGATRRAERHSSERDVWRHLAEAANIRLDGSRPIEQLVYEVLGCCTCISGPTD